MYIKIITAFLPTAILGLFLYKYIKLYLIGNSTVVIWSLLIGGIIMLLFEKFYKVKNKKLTTKSFVIIGLFQVLSMVPGVSRAFATIFGSMVVGMKRKDATEFSFFLAIPTMFAATALDLFKTDLSLWTNSNFSLLLIGFVGSFITAYFAIKFLINFVQSHNFNVFGWYRIVLALLYILLVV